MRLIYEPSLDRWTLSILRTRSTSLSPYVALSLSHTHTHVHTLSLSNPRSKYTEDKTAVFAQVDIEQFEDALDEYNRKQDFRPAKQCAPHTKSSFWLD